VADALHIQLVGHDADFSSVSTDSRTLEPGALFIALQGPRFDGHDYIDVAEARGAAAIMVSREVSTPLPMLLVEDTRSALGRMSQARRRHFDLPVIAVTGSNGKTTVKEMIASILSRKAPVLATAGNLNNDIGVPLTLMRLEDQHRYAVIEMGANHAGEIAGLCELANPGISVITNAGGAHLEGFGSLEGVARAKGEIITALPHNGIAVINADDPHAALWMELAGDRETITFGMKNAADVSVDPAAIKQQADIGKGLITQFSIKTPQADIPVVLRLPGMHNVMNAIAAAAVAIGLGVDADSIRSGLERMRSVSGRLAFRKGRDGRILIDDTYNANPSSLAAALDVLSAISTNKILVLGDMGELGTDAAELHRQAGHDARTKGIDHLYATGDLARQAVEAFGADAQFFADQEALIAGLESLTGKGDVILVKGSRFMKMDRIIAAISEPEENGDVT
jgi:UDP-N-acetylmuramoyl-tripeptide--D-alanyl-D-alanine ligase